jgi:hypothetical protein
MERMGDATFAPDKTFVRRRPRQRRAPQGFFPANAPGPAVVVVRATHVLVVAVVVLVALSGCSAKNGKGDKSASSSASASGTGLPGNQTLQARITVLVAGNLTAPTNGTVHVPKGTVITFDASKSTGPVYTYAWSFGDNATSSDKVKAHTYAAPGMFNVTLKVKSVGNATSNATLKVDVMGVKSGAALGNQTFSFTGSLPVMNPNSCTTQGVDCKDNPVPVVGAVNGTAAKAHSVHIVLHGSGGGVQMFVAWVGPDGTTLAAAQGSSADQDLTYGGDMPPGDYVVRVRLFVGAQASYTVSGEIAYATV